ncbi:hypothetical protein BH09SUM1_BH09SUM1_15470 [soil metagenome]
MDNLTRECRVFTRYLIGAWPRPEIVERYSRWNELRGGAGDNRFVQMAVRRPWMTALLDGGCGVIDRDNLLRKKLLALTAILETHPAYAGHFLPRDRSLIALFFILAKNGFCAALKSAVGSLLVLGLRR